MPPLSTRQVPLVDLHAQHSGLREEILAALQHVVDSGRFINGPEVRQLESELAALCGASRAVACNSGTDALLLALMGAGVTAGDSVLTTPFSFFSTAGSISRLGARPIFADIDPATYTLDPGLATEALRANPGIKAMIPVHLYGGCADMDPLLDLAAEHGCFVIEDGAQAIGATYKNRPALSLAQAGCLSFFPTKNLGALGDGGMVVSNDEMFAARVAALADHGSTRRYHHDEIGINSRLDTLQAAALLVKLRRLGEWTRARIANAAIYLELLAGTPVALPKPAPFQTCHVYHQFVIRCPRRDALMEHLRGAGIGCEIYYPVPIHLQHCYRDLGYREGSLPHSERAAQEALALPIRAGLSSDDIEYVCDHIRAFYA